MRHGATTFAGTLMLLLCFTQAASACPDDDLRTDQSQRPAQQPKVKEGGKDDLHEILPRIDTFRKSTDSV
jgi:hypothetical protein